MTVSQHVASEKKKQKQSNQDLLLILVTELQEYEFGNEGIFDGWMQRSVFCKTKQMTITDRNDFIYAMSSEQCRREIDDILDELVEYDEEKVGLFDYILEKTQ